MRRTQILLDPEQHDALVEIANKEGRSLSDLIRKMLDEQLKERNRIELEKAARELIADYQDDPEFTAFSALDADDFHAQG
jgi:hypothetical protein